MALRQFAVFMNAGSYVISPKLSGAVLIWRRSIARIVPSWTGSSYVLPVRLSVIEIVSAIGDFRFQTSDFRLSSSGSSTGSAATLYVPSAQRARSCSLHRSLQNGRQVSSTACRRQKTQSDCDIALFYTRISCGSVAFGGVVADVLGQDHEDDVLGDVGRVVADAFEVAGDQDQVERRLDGRGILQHVGQQLPENLRLQRVERIVLVEDVLGELGVAAHEGVQRVAEHALGDGRHARDVDELLDRRVADVLPRRFGDVDREVADPDRKS